ncbi:MAG: flagellin [Parvularculaceae bacterium]
MTRISDLGFQQILLSSFQRAQSSAQDRQIQLATGKISDSYGGIGAATAQLLTSEGVMTRATGYQAAANIAATRFQTQEAALTEIADSVARLRADIVTTLATGSAQLLTPEFETEAQRILGALNTSVGGVYVFGGVDGTIPPVNATTLADIAGAANTNTLFNNAARTQMLVEEGAFVDGGAVASDVASDLLARLKDFADAPASLGAFSGTPTAAQSTFLTQMIADLDAISAQLYDELGYNAIAQGQTDAALTRNTQRRDLAEIVAAEIENVDLAEVVSRLNQDQIAIEAAAQALAQSRELSLLNYL